MRLTTRPVGMPAQRRVSPSAVLVTSAILGAALIAWVLSVFAMRLATLGQSGLRGPAWQFLGLWMLMMAAMMLPSVWPTVLAHCQVASAYGWRRRKVAGSCCVFVAGYLLAWTAYGVVVLLAYHGIASLHLPWLVWDRGGALAAACVIALAGVYQLTPFKLTCLRNCQSPLAFMLHEWRPGLVATLRTGAFHGLWCLGCCFGLMLLLVVLGVMSILWMAVVTLMVAAEKILPWRATRFVVAALCLSLAAGVALVPL